MFEPRHWQYGQAAFLPELMLKPLYNVTGMNARKGTDMIVVGDIVETKDNGRKGIVTRKFAGIHILFSDGSFGYRDSDELRVIGWADIRKIFNQIENTI